MSKKHKKAFTTLNYNENFLIVGSTITGCISICDFSSLVETRGMSSFATGFKKYRDWKVQVNN